MLTLASICLCRTYSVSVVIAPLNLATGELCDETTGTAYWDRILVYYAASSAFQLAGMVAFVVLAYTDVGAAAFSKKDAQLERAAVTTPRRRRAKQSPAHALSPSPGSPQPFERRRSEKGWIVPTSDGEG